MLSECLCNRLVLWLSHSFVNKTFIFKPQIDAEQYTVHSSSDPVCIVEYKYITKNIREIIFLIGYFSQSNPFRCTVSCLPCYLRNCFFKTLECAVNTEGSDTDITFQNQQNLTNGLYCNEEHCSAMDLFSYESKGSEKNERDMHLKDQITDLQTLVFIAQIKVCAFGGGGTAAFI